MPAPRPETAIASPAPPKGDLLARCSAATASQTYETTSVPSSVPHLNPVRAGLVSTPEELDRFPFSGHGVVVGTREAPWQDMDGVLARFTGGISRAEAVHRYREFVLAGWNQGHRHEFTGGGLIRSAGGREQVGRGRLGAREAADERILGSGQFVEDVWRADERVEPPRAKRAWQEVLEEAARKWEVTPDQILGRSRERAISSARREFLFKAYEQSGLLISELAKVCGMSHVSVRSALLKARSGQTEG